MAITDLTNTTWVVPAGWSATAGLVQANITGSVLCEDVAAGSIDLNTELGNAYTFSIGYRSINNTLSDRIYINTSAYGDPTPKILASSYAFTITITGGVDATNPVLIAWLETYSEKPTPTDAVTIEYNGAVIASLKAGQSATLPCKDKPMLSDVVVTVPEGLGGSVEEWDGSYTISGGIELINFTIDDMIYQAEEGMTWAEWVDSDYNIYNYFIENDIVYISRNVDGVTPHNYIKDVIPTDIITADESYEVTKIPHSGGGID